MLSVQEWWVLISVDAQVCDLGYQWCCLFWQAFPVSFKRFAFKLRFLIKVLLPAPVQSIRTLSYEFPKS